jgi:hypothetical protein
MSQLLLLVTIGSLLLLCSPTTVAFTSSSTRTAAQKRSQHHCCLLHSTSSPQQQQQQQQEMFVQNENNTPSDEWELDCYSRPVLVGNKKLWEVLITDSNNSFRYLKTLPSNAVNSRELRKVVEQLMEDSRIPVKPTTIRFFRGAMFNMVRI